MGLLNVVNTFAFVMLGWLHIGCSIHSRAQCYDERLSAEARLAAAQMEDEGIYIVFVGPEAAAMRDQVYSHIAAQHVMGEFDDESSHALGLKFPGRSEEWALRHMDGINMDSGVRVGVGGKREENCQH